MAVNTHTHTHTHRLLHSPTLYDRNSRSKMQEDAGSGERYREAKVRGGRSQRREGGREGGIRNIEGRSTTPLGGIPGYVLNCCIPNLLVYVCYRVSYSCAAAKESARRPNFMCTVPA